MKDNIIVVGNWIFIKIEVSEKFCGDAEDKYMACGRYGGLMPEHIYTKKELLEKKPDAIILEGINPSNTVVTTDK